MIQRLFSYLHHITRAAASLDMCTMIQLFVLRRASVHPLPARIKNGKGFFWYRGFTDRGVMSHFYEVGYDIYSESGKRIDCILDLGANIGDETVKFAMRHPEARILAVEPEQGNYELLRRNAEPYGSRITALHAGAWHADATLEIVPGSTPEAFTVVESAGGSIHARSISSLVKEFNISKIDILKIDIEGSEYSLFERDSESWLPFVDAIVIEIADVEKSGSFQNFFRSLERANFQGNCYICGENIVAIRARSGLKLRKIQGV